MEQYIKKSAIEAEIENLLDKSTYLEEYDCAYRDGNNGALYALKGKLDTLETKEVDISNISENLAEAYEYLDYTSTGNLAHNKPMVSARLEKAIRSLFDAGLFELTHDTKYRMENLGLKAQKGEEV